MMTMMCEAQRKRINNINMAHSEVKKFRQKMRITDYMPGQITYHLGEYPKPFKIEPTEYDENLIKSLKERGFEMIQVHSEWHDWLRLYGGDDYSSHDEEGMKNFVKLCHKYDMKVLIYLSSGFLDMTHPGFKEEFRRYSDAILRGGFLNLAVCWHGSPEWREFLWDKLFTAVERYGFDGIYNDMGYDWHNVKYFEHIKKYGSYNGEYDDLPYETELEDFLAMIYNECKRRGLIYKLHITGYGIPKADVKVYDYLWVGEGVRDVKEVISRCRGAEQYIVPAFDRRTSILDDLDLAYSCTLPFVQFPILYHGRPITQYGEVEGVTYYKSVEFDGEGNDFFERAVEHYEKTGEATYSEWSSIPDDPQELERATRYLKLYKPMVTDESVVRIEIREADFIKSEIPEDVYISLFTNEEQYLLVSNITDADYELELKGEWVNRETNECSTKFIVPKNKMLFLKQVQ